MALFKIFKGDSNRLQSQKITEGYAYFTPDDGKFYIDIGTEAGAEPLVGNSTQETINGNPVNRICINQKLFNYNDYDVLDCGTSNGSVVSELIFDCN